MYDRSVSRTFSIVFCLSFPSHPLNQIGGHYSLRGHRGFGNSIPDLRNQFRIGGTRIGAIGPSWISGERGNKLTRGQMFLSEPWSQGASSNSYRYYRWEAVPADPNRRRATLSQSKVCILNHMPHNLRWTATRWKRPLWLVGSRHDERVFRNCQVIKDDGEKSVRAICECVEATIILHNLLVEQKMNYLIGGWIQMICLTWKMQRNCWVSLSLCMHQGTCVGRSWQATTALDMYFVVTALFWW